VRIKAKDQIKLSGGEITTLGDALDRGLLYVWTGASTGRKRQGERREIVVFYAWGIDADGDLVTLPIGQKLYESRLATAGKSPTGNT
jgi:hypothetical protein